MMNLLRQILFSTLVLIFSLSAHALLGGDYSSGEFQSSVKMMPIKNKRLIGLCSAGKIAEHWFISAAHCGVISNKTGNINNFYQSGSIIGIESFDKKMSTLTIEKVHPHPSYLHLKRELINSNKIYDGNGLASESYDVLMVKVKEKTPNIPISPIYFEKLPLGKKIIITGYGEEFVPEAITIDEFFDLPKPKYELKFGESYLIPPSNNILNDSMVFTVNKMKVPQFNIISAGTLINNTVPSVRFGDSGGVVYIEDEGKFKIVGVNSLTTAMRTTGNMANFHTRLSDLKPWIVGLLDN